MRHVLVVDDDPSTRLTYRLALNAAGFDVSLADSASAAIAAIAAIASGAESGGVLLDLNLGGGMTGYDLLGWMRASGHLRPTAVMTAFRLDFDPDEAIALGAVAYADQPLSLEDVVSLAKCLTRPPS